MTVATIEKKSRVIVGHVVPQTTKPGRDVIIEAMRDFTRSAQSDTRLGPEFKASVSKAISYPKALRATFVKMRQDHLKSQFNTSQELMRSGEALLARATIISNYLPGVRKYSKAGIILRHKYKSSVRAAARNYLDASRITPSNGQRHRALVGARSAYTLLGKGNMVDYTSRLLDKNRKRISKAAGKQRVAKECAMRKAARANERAARTGARMMRKAVETDALNAVLRL